MLKNPARDFAAVTTNDVKHLDHAVAAIHAEADKIKSGISAIEELRARLERENTKHTANIERMKSACEECRPGVV
jgi:hypothetical protein